jgi:hypothetical protein
MMLLAALMLAQTAAACPAGAEPLPAALSAWAAGTSVSAKADVKEPPTMVVGTPAEVTLHPAAHVELASKPGKPAATDSHGGYVTFVAAKPGTYRVALSNPSWIELLTNGKPVTSTRHGHGPRCSGMRKIVDFNLPAGLHMIQLSGSPDATMRVMVVRG